MLIGSNALCGVCRPVSIAVFLCFLVLFPSPGVAKQPVKALYIPLADHYAALVAYERYRSEMQHADFQIELMPNWDLLRAAFHEGLADMAFVMSPLAMDMYHRKPHFSWVGLMHRDGNALAVNAVLASKLSLPKARLERKPDEHLAQVLREVYEHRGEGTHIGMPHFLSTHTVVLYRYLKQHGLNMSTMAHSKADVIVRTIAPPKSPAFIRSRANRSIPAAFEQSLPWADVVETDGAGKVAWYSKDVMPWPGGHVECIMLAQHSSIASKEQAIQEVVYYIQKAGADIERARESGGQALQDIVNIVRKHIPAHNTEAIVSSLSTTLAVINYRNLNIDKSGLRQIMEYAVEGGILSSPIDIEAFSDSRFFVPLDSDGLPQ